MKTSGSRRAAGLRRPTRAVAAIGLLAATLLGLFASPSAADPPERPPRLPLARIQLSLTPAGDPAAVGPTTTVELTCTPDGGTHPTPREACGSLRRVNGDFARLPGVLAPCPAIYDPHVASARGFWRPSPSSPAILISYAQTFANRCVAAISTDNVFRF